MIEAAPTGSVVCGVDGSQSSLDAVAWAASEASRRKAPLVIVHAWQFPLYHVPLDSPVVAPPDGGMERAAERVLSDAEDRARAAADDVEVTGRLIAGGAAGAMLAVAEHAALVVLGSRGLGGVTGLLVGSVGVQVSAHAPCPVIVIRRHADAPEAPHRGQVVVGVDGSEPGRAALAFGLDEADRMGVPLVAVSVYHAPTVVADTAVPTGVTPDDLADATTSMLRAEIERCHPAHPNVPVDTRVIESSTGWALVREAAGCELLVVGSRGHGGFAGLLLGSVSQYALHHAQCPVAVIRTSYDVGDGQSGVGPSGGEQPADG